jgi:hypothetical protein
MSTFSNAIRKPFGIILPLNEVKSRAVISALDKCGGHYLLAARLLGIGRSTIYRMARTCNYQPPRVQAEGLMSISQCKPSYGLNNPGVSTWLRSPRWQFRRQLRRQLSHKINDPVHVRDRLCTQSSQIIGSRFESFPVCAAPEFASSPSTAKRRDLGADEKA